MKNVKYLSAFSFFLFFLVINSFALDMSGKVTAENSSKIENATLVLLELDMITVTDAEGNFDFRDIPEGLYTVLVMAPGYPETEFPGISAGYPVILRLAPEIIEMETITVKAEREAVKNINDGVTSEELERQPAGSDPFDAVVMEEGILDNLNIMTAAVSVSVSQSSPETGSIVLPEGRLSRTGYDTISVYGGEADWNNYYYDYIRMPSNKHDFGFPEAEPVIPIEAVESIDVYRGAYPLEYGPGIGGCFVLNPIKAADGWTVELTPTTSQLAGISTISFSPNVSLLASLTQSILNITTLPFINILLKAETEDDLNSEGTPTSINYGDLLLSLRITPPDHQVSVDLTGFYDNYGFDLNVNESFFKMDNIPYFLAAGARWLWSVTPGIGNSLYLFGSLYQNTGNFDYDFRGEAFYDNISVFHQDWVSRARSLQAGEEVQIAVTPDTLLLTGATGRISSLYGTLTDDQYAETSEGIILADYSHSILLEDLLASVYGYGKIIGSIKNMDYQLGSGVLWYPETMTVRPAVEGEAVYSLKNSSFALSAGWSPGIIDEFSFIDRRLDELYYKLETETVADQPPMTVTGAGQTVFLFNEDDSLKFSPYYSWYYDLTGLNMSTSYTDLEDTFISLEPSEGYSTGIDIKWSSKYGEHFKYDIGYAFSRTRYLTKESGWIVPGTEVQHALKGSATYKKEGFKAGLKLLIYCGQPFTPEIVQDSIPEPVTVLGDYNSAYNYVPSYELTANLSWEDHSDKFDTKLFFNSSNLVDGLNFSMSGLKEELKSTVGATSADFNSRDYNFDYTLTDLLIMLLTCEIGFSISF